MHRLDPGSICAPSDDVVSREIEGELIIVPIASGIGDLEDELYTLNRSGKEIWQRLDGHRSLEDIAAELANLYAASPERIVDDVLGLCTELAERRIIVCRE